MDLTQLPPHSNDDRPAGRPPKITPETMKILLRMLRLEYSSRDIQKHLGWAPRTYYRAMRRLEDGDYTVDLSPAELRTAVREVQDGASIEEIAETLRVTPGVIETALDDEIARRKRNRL